MTDDDAALREAAVHLLACDEEDAGQDLTAWARNLMYGPGSETHAGDCTREAYPCRACARERHETKAARIVGAYMAAGGDARLAERERCARIVERYVGCSHIAAAIRSGEEP